LRPLGGALGIPGLSPAPLCTLPSLCLRAILFALILYYRVLLLHGSGAEDTHAAPSAAIPEQQQQAGSGDAEAPLAEAAADTVEPQTPVLDASMSLDDFLDAIPSLQDVAC
jgi:hypothetical protein